MIDHQQAQLSLRNIMHVFTSFQYRQLPIHVIFNPTTKFRTLRKCHENTSVYLLIGPWDMNFKLAILKRCLLKSGCFFCGICIIWMPWAAPWYESTLGKLTYCGLMTPYGDINLGQPVLKQWLVAMRLKPVLKYHNKSPKAIDWALKPLTFYNSNPPVATDLMAWFIRRQAITRIIVGKVLIPDVGHNWGTSNVFL